MRISDWSSDVCSSDLSTLRREAEALSQGRHAVTVADDAGIDLSGSTRELHSAFSNLVSHAVRYTPTGGDIAIRLRSEGRRVGKGCVSTCKSRGSAYHTNKTI